MSTVRTGACSTSSLTDYIFNAIFRLLLEPFCVSAILRHSELTEVFIQSVYRIITNRYINTMCVQGVSTILFPIFLTFDNSSV